MLRETIGNAMFFSVYEYVRYHIHSHLKSASPDHRNLIDVGVGVASGGLGGIAVCIYTNCPSYLTDVHILMYSGFLNCDFLRTFLPVLVSCSTLGCGQNHNSDYSG